MDSSLKNKQVSRSGTPRHDGTISFRLFAAKLFSKLIMTNVPSTLADYISDEPDLGVHQ